MPRNLFRLHLAKGLLLFKVSILLLIIVLALAVLPYKIVLARVNGITPKRNRQGTPNDTKAKRINWALAKAGRYIPQAKCLAMALAGKVLYARAGYPAELRIGVDKIGDKKIRAHAWVESRGEIVIGELHDLSSFKILDSPEIKKP